MELENIHSEGARLFQRVLHSSNVDIPFKNKIVFSTQSKKNIYCESLHFDISIRWFSFLFLLILFLFIRINCGWFFLPLFSLSLSHSLSSFPPFPLFSLRNKEICALKKSENICSISSFPLNKQTKRVISLDYRGITGCHFG